MKNLYEQIVRENAGYDGLAVTDEQGTYTYPELFAKVEETAEALRKSGIGPFTACGFLAEDSAAYIVYALAILKLGASVIPLSARSAQTELESMIQALPMNCLIAENAFAGESGETLPNGFRIQRFDRPIREIRFQNGEIPAFIRFSSGTTGASKGVILSHKSVLERTDACTGLAVRRGDRVLWVLDMAYHFVVTILLFLRRGAEITVCGRPIETRMAEFLRRCPPALLYATPYHFQIMNSSPDIAPELLRGLRLAISTAMKLQTRTAEEFQTKFGIPLRQAYGIIEIGLPCIDRLGEKAHEGSVGRLQPAYEVRIADPAPDGTGAIQIRGPGMFDAYLAPFQLREELCPDGFFATGDLGYLDAEGCLFIVGRAKNVINFAGMKIFPYEVEDVLLQCPLIRDAQAYGVPDASFGEIPAAKIVPADADSETDALIRAVRKHCYAKLPGYKVPKQFETVSELPKTASGKLIRRK